MSESNLASAEHFTRLQLETAKNLIDKSLRGDTRQTDGALLGAVLVALATNFATMEASEARTNGGG